jgi:SAM-dependent methyltransferase
VTDAVAAGGWEAAIPFFADATRTYSSWEGKDPYSAAVETSVQVMTSAVPARADRLLAHLRERQGFDLRDKDMIEVGTGLGALATYLTAKGMPRRFLGTDIDEKSIELASSSLHVSGLGDRLDFRTGDMRNLDFVETDSFDVLLANGALIYLATEADLAAGLDEITRILRPGGIVLFYHANRWRWREPFSKAPVVHMLPRPAADLLQDRLGWKHNRDRIQLTGPLALRRRLQSRGFGNAEIVGHGYLTYPFPPFSWLGNFYALSARLSGPTSR